MGTAFNLWIMRYASIYFTIFLLSVALLSCTHKSLKAVTESTVSQVTTDTMLANRVLSILTDRMTEHITRQSLNTSAITLITDSTVIVKDTDGRILDYYHSRGKDTESRSDNTTASREAESITQAVADSASYLSSHTDMAEKTEMQSEIKVAERPLSLWERLKESMVELTAIICIVAVATMIWLIHRKTA